MRPLTVIIATIILLAAAAVFTFAQTKPATTSPATTQTSYLVPMADVVAWQYASMTWEPTVKAGEPTIKVQFTGHQIIVTASEPPKGIIVTFVKPATQP